VLVIAFSTYVALAASFAAATNQWHRRISLRTFTAVVGCLLLIGSAARAQTPANPDVRRAEASRADLERLAADRELTTPAEAEMLRDRLKNGDFQPGDRIVLRVQDEPTLTDTFTVRTDRTLLLPNLPAISLQGVLHSELQDLLTKKIAQYIKNPDVQATSLIRVAVLGNVNKPGFYHLPAEMLASEAIMSAGGPGGNADVSKTTVRRNGAEIIDRKHVATAYARGATLDELNIHSGDEILVGEKSGGARATLATVGVISGLLIGIAAIGRVF
jgi:protein involved in polysaccharide export with SLBB domain